MIIVTGGAGFIGSNLVKALNARGHKDILVVDDLSDGHKFVNIADCNIADYLDKAVFMQRVLKDDLPEGITAIFHQGACSATTEWDGRYMMENNYAYSKQVLHYAVSHKIPFLYASSASVYGASQEFSVDAAFEKPLNVYGYSKLLFDQYVRRVLPQAQSQIVGFRYFNVYGPREQHKGSMASVAYHFAQQLKQAGVAKLFVGSEGYDDGEQRRDFVYIDDVVAVNLWFMAHPDKSGIFNLGTGRAQSFNEVAQAVIQCHGEGEIQYIPFPEHLRGKYQSFTQADISTLRDAGYTKDFKTVAEGVTCYLEPQFLPY